MAETNYTPVADGWHDAVKPCYVEVKEDYFNENSLIVSISFDMGDGAEQPNAKLPLVYASDHKIVKWEDGVRTEHTATVADGRAAYKFLTTLFPAWETYCREEHSTEDKLRWFERDGRDTVMNTAMDIKVWHSQSGFPNATVKDPTHGKTKAKVTKAAALQRASDMFKQMFGGAENASAGSAANATTDDNDIPF